MASRSPLISAWSPPISEGSAHGLRRICADLRRTYPLGPRSDLAPISPPSQVAVRAYVSTFNLKGTVQEKKIAMLSGGAPRGWKPEGTDATPARPGRPRSVGIRPGAGRARSARDAAALRGRRESLVRVGAQASAGASTSPRRCARAATCCCSTSRRTTSTSRRCARSRRRCRTLRAARWSSRTTAGSLTACALIRSLSSRMASSSLRAA